VTHLLAGREAVEVVGCRVVGRGADCLETTVAFVGMDECLLTTSTRIQPVHVQPVKDLANGPPHDPASRTKGATSGITRTAGMASVGMLRAVVRGVQ